MAIEIRELRPADIDAFADLCADREGLDRAAAERRAEQVSWIAFENPEPDGRPTYLVAADGDRLLAHLGRMPALLQIAGERRPGSYIHDLFVHPEVRERGRGFFTAMKLYRAAEAACPTFAALVWTNEINIALQKARKYEQLWVDGRAKLLALDVHIDRAVGIEPRAATGKAAARAALAVADRMIAATSRRRAIEAFDAFDERFDRLADRLGGRLGISPVKSRRYLEWKYAGWPHQRWAGHAAIDRDGELLGFVVVVAGGGVPPVASIAELVSDPDDAATAGALLRRAIERCRAAGVARINAMATDPRFARILERHLFLKRAPRQPLFLAGLERAGDPAMLRRPARWHLSYGDSEGAL